MNFRRTLSRSSLSSSSSSGKSLTHSEELSNLNADLESLNQVVESLKISVESKDVAIATLAREKEKLYVELKGAQRTNRTLLQQLVDERDIHSKEKEYLVEEIQRLSRMEEFEVNSDNHLSNEEQIIDSLQDQLLAKDKIIYEICEKFMKLKANKSCLHRRFQQLQMETQETYENILLLLQENKVTMDQLFENLLKFSTISRKEKKYLKLLQTNVKLNFENTQLKIGISRKNYFAKNSKHKVHEDIEQNPQCYPLRNENVTSKEDLSRSSKTKAPKYKVKMRPPKLKHSKCHSPSFIRNFYKEHKSLPALLHETITKSSSLPCLHFE